MSDLRRRTGTGLWFGIGVVLATALPWQVFGALLLAAGVVAVRELVDLRRAGAAALALGVLVITGLVALFWLRVDGGILIFVAILSTWAADIVAYLVGSRLGRRKLAPRVSPGKTWEGTLAGFAAAAVIVLLLGWVASAPDVEILAVLVGPVGLAGDLMESWVKRRAGVKDSGTLFPGHGGLLDRIDSLVAVALLMVALYAPVT